VRATCWDRLQDGSSRTHVATPVASKKRIAGSRVSSRTASLCLKQTTRGEFERGCPSNVRGIRELETLIITQFC